MHILPLGSRYCRQIRGRTYELLYATHKEISRSCIRVFFPCIGTFREHYVRNFYVKVHVIRRVERTHVTVPKFVWYLFAKGPSCEILE